MRSERILEEYLARTPGSAAMAARAAAVMPGGDTRAIAHHPPYPLSLAAGDGHEVVDVDGNRYLDLIMNYTSLVHGHRHPAIVAAVERQLARGTAWPARSEAQVALAEELVGRVGSVERVRFTNSGTEANMAALRIARAATGRHLVLMARFGYHGSADDTEVGTEGHEGPRTLVAPYGDAAAFADVLDRRGGEIAAVILEPVMGAAGVVPAPDGFLAAVADATRRAGAVFVLDEVITFRLATGGAQALAGVTPDLTTFAKLVGGGFPVGAVGGRADLMALTDPASGPVVLSGTFNGNPVTCAAGVESVRALTAERIAAMDELAERLERGLVLAADKAGIGVAVRRAGSLVACEADEPAAAAAFHLAALNRGVFMAARGLLCLSTVSTAEIVDDAVDRLTDALLEVAAATA